jgi:hypothetical protein
VWGWNEILAIELNVENRTECGDINQIVAVNRRQAVGPTPKEVLAICSRWKKLAGGCR